MKGQDVVAPKVKPLEIGISLRKELDSASSACVQCDLCQKECAFLRKYGKPKDIADAYNPSKKECQALPFECSLCMLCDAVCPARVNPSALFLEMRKETVRRGGADYPEHTIIEGYERRGASRRFSYYGLPRGCDTVFFPGCTLSGTRSEKVIEVFRGLRRDIPALGIVLDCCMKPSHDLGREDYFRIMFREMAEYLVACGVRKILVACPNCYKMFAQYGDGLTVSTIYEVLAHDGVIEEGRAGSGTVTIHDPCVVRFVEPVQEAVRALIKKQGLNIEEMGHSGRTTLCCGEGGAVGFLSRDLAEKWGRLRQGEAHGRTVVTYCAGCANSLSRLTPTTHLLDLIFEPEAALSGKARIARAPLTYWKRLRLKKWFKENVPVAVSRERTFTAGEEKKRGMVKFLLFLAFITFVIVAVKATGATRYLEQQTLRTWLQGYGPLAPIIYMLIYSIAPAFFLPGLPITIVGGILFGPFWGVVYTITSSTLGACVAFLVSRYLARGWVEQQLKSPRWRRLDEGVERHGWKVVAFTRLIPLFPFNLLNYAFGLTRISFPQYATATFLCMLPACIAFIVFSSSLLDLIRGKVSPLFVIGLLLVVLVSMFPLIYRRYKAKKGEGEPI